MLTYTSQGFQKLQTSVGTQRYQLARKWEGLQVARSLMIAVDVEAHGQYYSTCVNIGPVHLGMTGSARAEERRTCHELLVAPAASSTCHRKAIYDRTNILGARRERPTSNTRSQVSCQAFFSMEHSGGCGSSSSSHPSHTPPWCLYHFICRREAVLRAVAPPLWQNPGFLCKAPTLPGSTSVGAQAQCSHSGQSGRSGAGFRRWHKVQHSSRRSGAS